MADFPPNLDDGELWIPSDIFPDEMSSNISPKFSSELSAYSLLKSNQIAYKPPPNSLPNLQGQYGSGSGSGSAPRARFNGVGQNRYANDDGFRVGLGEIYQMRTTRAQVENYMQVRARVLRSLQNQNQNYFLPFQVTGPSINGGFVRESGGTGVFLPRVATTRDVQKRRYGVKKGEEIKQREPTKKNVVGKHGRLQLSPEVSLPQDWTY